MKSIFLVLVFFAATLSSTAQDKSASVEKSTFGIQTGILGIWVHNESKLSNSITLRSELGLDAGFSVNDNFVGDDIFALIPAITLEPRWYYNLNKRVSKSRRIDGNSGNFIALKISYHPDVIVYSNQNTDNINFISDISIIPTWGIRRNIGKHFNYETGIGIGYVRFLEDVKSTSLSENEVGVNLHLRIGYRF